MDQVKYSQEDLSEITQSYHNYTTESFDDWDCWLIEILHKKQWDLVDIELKRRKDLRNIKHH